ncbi:SPASM domain-containing protein [Pelotalea chapellei]|uniref:SPASM domain-containing protein n=1 Tax=Pelotalea chapellei TaxID=44671 RepID=UPI001FEC8994|nr:SPASM domain-containing protein [Pelotalea chapellei]
MKYSGCSKTATYAPFGAVFSQSNFSSAAYVISVGYVEVTQQIVAPGERPAGHPSLCRSYAGGWLHPVQPKVFGNLAEQGLLEIWNSAEFRSYREHVLQGRALHPGLLSQQRTMRRLSLEQRPVSVSVMIFY